MTQQATEETKQQDEVFTAEQIPGGLIKALSSFTATQRGRYALNCIHVNDNRIAAADGARLAEVTVPGTLGPEGLYKIGKPGLRKRSLVTLIRQNGSLRAVESGGEGSREEAYPEGEGTYPEYRQVIPPENAGTAVVAQLRYLKEAIDLLDCAGFRTARIALPAGGDEPFRIDGVNYGYGGKKLDHPVKATVVISPVIEEE